MFDDPSLTDREQLLLVLLQVTSQVLGPLPATEGAAKEERPVRCRRRVLWEHFYRLG